jgi:hypothetical protein
MLVSINNATITDTLNFGSWALYTDGTTGYIGEYSIWFYNRLPTAGGDGTYNWPTIGTKLKITGFVRDESGSPGQVYTVNPRDTFDLEILDNPSNDLVAYYPFNGNTNDESGKENHGIIHGATLTFDRFGNENQAYDFDGISDYIEADASDLPTAERTVSLWFYARTVDNRPGLLGYGGGGGGTSWFMGLNVNGRQSFHMSSHNLINAIDYNYSQKPIDTWYHWVITTENSGTKMYINGILVISNTKYVNNTIVNGKELGIGVITSTSGNAPYTDGNVKYFNGILDDIRIYNRALGINEIQILYHEGGWNE